MSYYHIDLDIGITTQQSRADVIQDALPHADQAEGITLTINGFGADSRELWQIAEVCDFMRILVGEGILSVLKMPNFREDGALIVNDPMGFGTLEVFLMTRNLNLSGTTISSDLMAEFVTAVRQANTLIVERYGSLNGLQCEQLRGPYRPMSNPIQWLRSVGARPRIDGRRRQKAITFMNENYQQYGEMCDHAKQQNKTTIFDALTAAGITRVTVEFDGYGNNGQIQGITARAGVADAELPQAAVAIHEVTHIRSADHEETKEEVKQQPLAEAIEGLCYNYLEEHHGGWVIDDGSFGQFDLDVASRIVRLEFTQRSSDFDCEEF